MYNSVHLLLITSVHHVPLSSTLRYCTGTLLSLAQNPRKAKLYGVDLR